MDIAPGTRLGPYEIVAALGAGGMGEVYRARDTRIDRTVAVKVLPSHLAADQELRNRFDREARAISSLNHPNICALYDLGCESGTDFLVLEHLEGQTLADRLASGPIPIAEALPIALEIVSALAAAHRAGIVHRDLKPANVFLVRGSGTSAPPTAKLLDFGLAKAATPVVATSGLSMLPTTPPTLTAQGAILGTFQYMAPEQIEGVEADARTDIFAFGALLFEMLTGRPAFEGKTRASLLGSILKDEPPRVSTVQPVAPATLDRLISTCLAKDPDDRYQTARDLLRDLKWIASAPADQPLTATIMQPRRSIRAARLVAAVVALSLISLTIAWRWQSTNAPEAAPVQFTFPPPEHARFGAPPGGGTGLATQLAVSPDGSHVVFVATSGNNYVLWLRSLGTLITRQIPGTEGAMFPFWSPDSRFIGFFAAGKMKKVPVSGGPPMTLCDAPGGRGGTWNADTIVFTPAANGPLARVAAAGGVPATISTLDTTYAETNHRFPHFLPDGRHYLYTAVTGAAGAAPNPSRIKIGSIDSTDSVVLFNAESSVQYASGRLIFLRDGTLMAQPFDPGGRNLQGDPVPIAEQISTEGSRYVSASTSRSGVMAYAHGTASNLATQLLWMDRSGKVLETVGDINALSVSLAPGDKKAVVSRVTGSPPNRDVWTLDLVRGSDARLTSDPADDMSPIWSPDGLQIAYFTTQQATRGIHIVAANGSAADQVLFKTGQEFLTTHPTDWSTDGRFVAFTGSTGGTNDIWILPLTGDKKPFPFVQSGPSSEDHATFAPDGKWIAYTSNETGQNQVYVQPFPATGGKHQISRSGGGQPAWRRDGRELFFIAPDGSVWSVAIDTTREFEFGVPQQLFTTRMTVGTLARHQFSVTKDGKRFLVIASKPETVITQPLTVIVNWLAALPK